MPRINQCSSAEGHSLTVAPYLQFLSTRCHRAPHATQRTSCSLGDAMAGSHWQQLPASIRFPATVSQTLARRGIFNSSTYSNSSTGLPRATANLSTAPPVLTPVLPLAVRATAASQAAARAICPKAWHCRWQWKFIFSANYHQPSQSQVNTASGHPPSDKQCQTTLIQQVYGRGRGGIQPPLSYAFEWPVCQWPHLG